MTKLYTKTVSTPVGELKVYATDSGLSAILWQDQVSVRHEALAPEAKPDHPILLRTEEQLKEYFAGTRRNFEIPLDLQGTEFQKTVWQALLTIPFGETRSYGQLAIQLAKPLASRAVGLANSRNPLPILIPCHRVIGANGKLTGFTGGLGIKEALLKHERPASAI